MKKHKRSNRHTSKRRKSRRKKSRRRSFGSKYPTATGRVDRNFLKKNATDDSLFILETYILNIIQIITAKIATTKSNESIYNVLFQTNEDIKKQIKNATIRAPDILISDLISSTIFYAILDKLKAMKIKYYVTKFSSISKKIVLGLLTSLTFITSILAIIRVSGYPVVKIKKEV